MLDDIPPAAPALPATPLDALGPTITEEIFLAGRTFRIERPDESDKLLANPAVRDAVAGEVYVPYWTDLWPAARMLGKWILDRRWPAGLTALEVGCGLGLPGLAALSMGVDVTFSDYDSTALHFVRRNARINGLAEPKTLQLDWRFPPDGVQFPVLLLADLIYEQRPADVPGPRPVEPVAASTRRRRAAVHDDDAPRGRAGRHAVQGDAVPHHAARRHGPAGGLTNPSLEIPPSCA
jgi:hypothetical protein